MPLVVILWITLDNFETALRVHDLLGDFAVIFLEDNRLIPFEGIQLVEGEIRQPKVRDRQLALTHHSGALKHIPCQQNLLVLEIMVMPPKEEFRIEALVEYR